MKRRRASVHGRAVCSRAGLAEHLTQIARIIHTEPRKVLADGRPFRGGIRRAHVPFHSKGRIDGRRALRGAWVFRARWMSKAADHLVRGGWIQTKPDQNDRRMVHSVSLPKPVAGC